MQTLRNATLVFLINRSETGTGDPGKISSICLAMKKRGFGVNRWNGAGGKVEQGESVEEAAKREVREEIGVEIESLYKVAELSFFFPHNPAWDQLGNVYFCEEWIGEPKESEEMRPAWFPVDAIPYKEMWPDDIFWLPRALDGNKIEASFTFGEDDKIISKKINLK